MDWLKQYSFLAEWLAIPVSIAIAYAAAKGKPVSAVNWNMVTVRAAFVLALSVAITDGHEASVHSGAITLAACALVIISFQAARS